MKYMPWSYITSWVIEFITLKNKVCHLWWLAWVIRCGCVHVQCQSTCDVGEYRCPPGSSSDVCVKCTSGEEAYKTCLAYVSLEILYRTFFGWPQFSQWETICSITTLCHLHFWCICCKGMQRNTDRVGMQLSSVLSLTSLRVLFSLFLLPYNNLNVLQPFMDQKLFPNSTNCSLQVQTWHDLLVFKNNGTITFKSGGLGPSIVYRAYLTWVCIKGSIPWPSRYLWPNSWATFDAINPCVHACMNNNH
jgi:hypothetical protein